MRRKRQRTYEHEHVFTMFLQCYEYFYAAPFPFIPLVWILCANNKRKIMQISILHSIWIQATKHHDEMKRYAEKKKTEHKRANTTFIRLEEAVLLTRISNRRMDQYRTQCIQNKLYSVCLLILSTQVDTLSKFSNVLESALAFFASSQEIYTFFSLQLIFTLAALLCANHCVLKVLMNETWFHCKMFAHR